MPVLEPSTIRSVYEAYAHYQQRTRGLKLRTIQGYWRLIRAFLHGSLGNDSVDVKQLTPQAVTNFIVAAQAHFCPSTMKLVTTSLRSFCQFLKGVGLCEPCLESAVPSVACRRSSSLPRGLSDQELRRLIDSLRTHSICGYRDRAIILCLATLAMRPGELAELKVDDIDWRAGTLVLRARKNGRGALLPLPQRVGSAIVDYLKNERPQTDERRLFVRHSRPLRGTAVTARIISCAVVRALKRAGIKSPILGAYVLRHTVAIGMVRRGTSLKEIADFFGHRHLDTTTIYAKADLPNLREVALEWPGVKS